MKRVLTLLLLMIVMVTGNVVLHAQVTTASLRGVVKDAGGEPLPGANVVAMHEPSGTTYGVSTQADGRYTINGMRVGGPYKITVTFVGQESQTKEEVYLSLGNLMDIDFALSDEGKTLEDILVTADRVNGDLFNSERTGAATNVNNNTIQSLPNISRGLKDFTKLSPFANTSGSGTSFAGASNRYNQFAIDGLVNNDVFGLSPSGTNGGQTGIEPISLDAIEEFQMNIAPYDVRQGGFTGGGINAVTRSGTNKFQGSLYFFGNNQNMVGANNPNTNEKRKYGDYNEYQTGFRVGGPIIKNKLFFFVNGEITDRNTPLPYAPGDAASNIPLSEVNRVLSTLNRIAPNYNPGAYDAIADQLKSQKIFLKIDWNINQNHKLTVRHSYTHGEQINNSRSPNSLRFYNNGVFFPTTTNSTGIELNSRFGNQFSNRLLLGVTNVVDDRESLGDHFPATTLYLTNERTIQFGSESSSGANLLKQTIYSLTDDFNYFKGKHTFTFGTHNEFYQFNNLFVQNVHGNYSFGNSGTETGVDQFAKIGTPNEVAPSFYSIGYSFDPSDGPGQTAGAAKFNAMQIGLYVQDEIQLSDRLRLTVGIRSDLPIFLDKPSANQMFNQRYGESGNTGVLPKTNILLSPRAGVNWDVFGNKSLQIRGGVGLFTGRVPFVWVSNQFTNNGEINGTYSTGSAPNGGPFTRIPNLRYSVNPYDQPTAESLGQKAGRGAINTISPNFKFPQVLRANLGVDKKLGNGFAVTFEALFSKTLNNVNFKNLNREENTAFAFSGIDNRPRYTAGRKDADFEEIISLYNTNAGYSYNVAVQLQKQFNKNFTLSASYVYGDSRDLNSGVSSVAYSNWRYVPNVQGPNNLSLTRSNYSAGSRVLGFISYKKEYLKSFSTQVSLFYNGQEGQPYSYIYAGDMNNDGTSNDLIYIPKERSEINLVDIRDRSGNVTLSADTQWQNLNAYIEGDKYLNAHRGEYAERNGLRSPFQHQFDFRLLQEFALKIGKTINRLQVTVDILNVGNLLNKEWGRQYYVANQAFSLINYRGLQGNASGGSTDYGDNVPTFTYTEGGQTNGKTYAASDYISRWRMQIGIRYIFN